MSKKYSQKPMTALLLNQIDELQRAIENKKPLDPKLAHTLQENLRIDWTYHSNAIEGNTLTRGETAFFLQEGLTSEGRPLKDYLEAKNHAAAIDGLMEIIKGKREITESLIKELHGVLMADIHFTIARGSDENQIQKPFHAGKYKIQPNHVMTLSGKIHYYADPIHVHDEMEKLLQWYHESKHLHAVERAAIFHYRFVSIHPFDDGNGRMARILMNLILMQSGYPPCIIKAEARRDYLARLELTDQPENDYSFFIQFVAQQLIDTENKIIEILEDASPEKNKTSPTEKLKEPLKNDEMRPPRRIGLKKNRSPAQRDEIFLRETPADSVFQRFLNKEERQAIILQTIGKESQSIGQLLGKLPYLKRPTLKKDLQELVRTKKLKKRGEKKGVTYSK